MKPHQNIISNFSGVRALAVGDVMLDRYLYGDAERLSVEAPVPILREQSRRHVLGGAGNVASNLSHLGGKVFLAGVIGDDEEGKIVSELCRASGVGSDCLIMIPKRLTTAKTRVMAHHHQLVRVDCEDDSPIPPAASQEILDAVSKLQDINLIIFSDYAKGVINKSLVEAVIKKFDSAKVIADFKPRQAEFYRKGLHVILPNTREALGITGIDASSDDESAEMVLKKLAELFGSHVVLKRGAAGLSVFDRDTEKIYHLPTSAREVFDVTGAGDTVAAALGLAIVSGADLMQAAEIANRAAGIVVELEGTAVASQEDLEKRLAESDSDNVKSKSA